MPKRVVQYHWELRLGLYDATALLDVQWEHSKEWLGSSQFKGADLHNTSSGSLQHTYIFKAAY